MDIRSDPTAQKLLKAFRQLGKAEWHQRSVGGYRPSEVRILLCIRKGASPEKREMKVSEISKYLDVTSPSITPLIKSLEAHGLVERNIDPADRRVVYTKLTPRGEAIAQEAWEDFSNSISGLIDYLGEEQSNQLAELLSKVHNYFREKAGGTVEQSACDGENKL